MTAKSHVTRNLQFDSAMLSCKVMPTQDRDGELDEAEFTAAIASLDVSFTLQPHQIRDILLSVAELAAFDKNTKTRPADENKTVDRSCTPFSSSSAGGRADETLRPRQLTMTSVWTGAPCRWLAVLGVLGQFGANVTFPSNWAQVLNPQIQFANREWWMGLGYDLAHGWPLALPPLVAQAMVAHSVRYPQPRILITPNSLY